MKNLEVAKKMSNKDWDRQYNAKDSSTWSPLRKALNSAQKDINKNFGKKGRESLNPPRKGRDNEVMEGKGEKELN